VVCTTRKITCMCAVITGQYRSKMMREERYTINCFYLPRYYLHCWFQIKGLVLLKLVITRLLLENITIIYVISKFIYPSKLKMDTGWLYMMSSVFMASLWFLFPYQLCSYNSFYKHASKESVNKAYTVIKYVLKCPPYICPPPSQLVS